VFLINRSWFKLDSPSEKLTNRVRHENDGIRVTLDDGRKFVARIDPSHTQLPIPISRDVWPAGSPAFRPERGDERGERIGQTTHFGFLFNSPRIRFATFSLRYLWWRRKPAATFLALRPRNRGFKLVRYQQIRAITITICHAFRWPTTFCIFGLRARVVVLERNRVQSEKIPGEIDT